MANYKLEYSQIVRRKLKSLRAYLKAEYGEEVAKKSIKKITDAARGLQKLPNKGVELALASECDYIVTYNLKDFKRTEELGIKAITPGEFIEILLKEE